MHKHDKESILIETLAEGGTITAACRRAGVSRMFYDRHYKSDRTFQKRVDEARALGEDTADDLVVTMLSKKIREGNWPALHYALKKRDKMRSAEPNQTFGLGDIQTLINSLPESQQSQYHDLLCDLLLDATMASQAEKPSTPEVHDL